MKPKRPRILILNAALAGDAGNTAVALERVRKALGRGGRVEVRTVTVAGGEPTRVAEGAKETERTQKTPRRESAAAKRFGDLRAELAWAEAFVFGTGTHWDSWSSVLQTFLEDATETEGTKLWLGKPAACVVTEHSVGGKGVLSRLQGVLVTLGCQIPPMSGLVLSQVAQLATARSAIGERREPKQPKALRGEAKGAKAGPAVESEAAGTQDFWCAEDLAVVAHNLIEAAKSTRRWKTWPVDRTDFSTRWME